MSQGETNTFFLVLEKFWILEAYGPYTITLTWESVSQISLSQYIGS